MSAANDDFVLEMSHCQRFGDSFLNKYEHMNINMIHIILALFIITINNGFIILFYTL